MLPKCRQAVIEAAKAAKKRPPTDAQIQDIESRIGAAMTQLAREDMPAWRSLTTQGRYRAAADRAMSDIKAEAAKKLEQAKLQIQRTAETAERLKIMQDARDRSAADALSRDAMVTDQMARSERRTAMGRMMSVIQAAGSKEGAGIGRSILMTLFDAENPHMTGAIVREIFANADGHTGSKMATAAARAWLDTIDELRLRFNRGGGDVGALDYGYVPQPHDTARIRKAGRYAWVERTMPRVDRSRYLLEDGTRMGDDDLRETLGAIYKTLESEGLYKHEPGTFTGSGKRANRGSDHRQLHFKDGEAWVEYMREFGKGSLYDAMMGHVSRLTRDVTLIERYGPDVNAQRRLQMDLARRADGKAESESLTPWHTVDPDTYFRLITGEVGTPKSEPLARTAMMVRSMMTAAKLGRAVISSLTDIGTLITTAGYNRLPYWELLRNIGRQGTKEAREFMAAHGMIAESVADNLNRWSGDNVGTDWSGKLANSVLRWSLLNAWTDGLRAGFEMTMNATLARLVKTDWSALSEFDRVRFQRSGLTEADWTALSQVRPALYKGTEMLSPQAIKAAGNDALAAKVFGFILDESEFAVINPDLTGRAITTMGGLQAGTPSGEIVRTVMQFKSFPIAMMTRHWRRLAEMDHLDGAPAMANRVVYGTALMATLLGLGAIAAQAKQVLDGKDPINMVPDNKTGARFWVKALAQGGGFAIAGDLFLIDPASTFGNQAGNLAKNVLGPTFGAGADLALTNITGNIWEASYGKDTHWEAELLNWAKQQAPGTSLWWVKPMLDRALFDQLNENLSPGYLAKVKARAQRDWHQGYWWAPGQIAPSRPPDLESAAR